LIPRVETGVRNLDAVLDGGLPRGSITVVSGPPGSGKTILSQQICFRHASPEQRILFLSTLSEPTAKTLLYMKPFDFFDPERMEDGSFEFVDLSEVLCNEGLEQATAAVLQHLRRVKPAFLVIDSFKVFDDLATSPAELRRFTYELAINLLAWECTTLLVGEHFDGEAELNPLMAIADAFISLTQREAEGEQQRFLRVIKMRGTAHHRDEYPFMISKRGVDVFAPRVTIHREVSADVRGGNTPRCRTGLQGLDELLGEGIPRGSSLLVGGVAGTGKTVLLLEFIYWGAVTFKEKGIIFSFEETPERLLATARGLGWDLEAEIRRGMVEIVFIPQPEIRVEEHLLMMRERVETLGAGRVAIDSVSVFLHKLKDPQAAREKVFQLTSIVQNTEAVGLFATDIPYGSVQISRFGVEETVVDGIILLSSTEQGLDRERYVEVYKLRNSAHLKGRHSMRIGHGGMKVFPRYEVESVAALPPVDPARRLSTGIPRLDDLVGGGLLLRSVTLVSGSAGVGKSTFGVQFLLEGARRGELGLYVALEESPAQIRSSAEAMQLGVKPALVDFLTLSREDIRSARLIAVLSERIQRTGVRRLVLDSASHLESEGLGRDALLRLLYALTLRLKTLNVTSVFTLEAESLFSLESVTARCLSPVADNLIALRYTESKGRIDHAITIVKTRGSAHDQNTHRYSLGIGGMAIEGPVETAEPAGGRP
jgi:circadian clock protein KaiC